MGRRGTIVGFTCRRTVTYGRYGSPRPNMSLMYVLIYFLHLHGVDFTREIFQCLTLGICIFSV